MKINQKSLIIILSIFVVFLIGTYIYFAEIKNINIFANQSSLSVDIIKTYKNETNGYQIQYPSFFAVDDSDPSYVSFLNNSCLSNTGLCIPSITSIDIEVSDNKYEMNADQYIQGSWKYVCSKINKIKIFPLPENFNENELIEAIRCESDEVPKQALGGYTYVIFKGNKIFEINVTQGDSTILAYGNGSLFNIAKDTYDPLGDIMMRTFRFVK